jgi:hypothetical protein
LGDRRLTYRCGHYSDEPRDEQNPQTQNLGESEDNRTPHRAAHSGFKQPGIAYGISASILLTFPNIAWGIVKLLSNIPLPRDTHHILAGRAYALAGARMEAMVAVKPEEAGTQIRKN